MLELEPLAVQMWRLRALALKEKSPSRRTQRLKQVEALKCQLVQRVGNEAA